MKIAQFRQSVNTRIANAANEHQQSFSANKLINYVKSFFHAT